MVTDAPDIKTTNALRFACDGGEGSLGHPRIWLSIPPEKGWLDCPYCDTRYVIGGEDKADAS